MWKVHKNPSQVSSGVKSQVTVVGCVSASGQGLPSMVIWDRKMLPPELAIGEVPGTIYGLSDKGWMDQELFDMWFHRHFLRYATPAHPLLLLMDGHSSHYCPGSAAQERVILFSLPPNTTLWAFENGLETSMPHFYCEESWCAYIKAQFFYSLQ